jgi:uncharacterized protein (TIGR02452 family)
MSRSNRKLLAEETLKIFDSGNYKTRMGRSVSIREELKAAVSGSKLYRPDDFDAVHLQAEKILDSRAVSPMNRLSVEPATTFAASRALSEAGAERVICLNFASAKNPGGGFLGGSQAQEEALARASGLYPCLSANFEYYKFNRAKGGSVYSNHLIYSPAVPVFRDDNDDLMDDIHLVSIITAPAVNVGALPASQRKNKELISAHMLERTENVLAVALNEGYTHLVLGAWGCGVFRNNPRDVAGYFKHFLSPEGKYARAFEGVVFAVPDFPSSLANYNGFLAVFEG